MNKTSQFGSGEISQTALVLLTLLAAGKSIDQNTVQSLCALLAAKDDSENSMVNLTVFSGSDVEDENTEPPVIIPFARHSSNENRHANGFGALSFKNRIPAYRDESRFRLRIFSPDAATFQDEDDSSCLEASMPALRVYAE